MNASVVENTMPAFHSEIYVRKRDSSLRNMLFLILL